MTSLHAERARDSRLDLPGFHIAWLANAVAIDCCNVLGAGRRSRDFPPIAEDNRGFRFVVGFGNEFPVVRRQSRECVRLVPLNLIHAQDQSACGARGGRRCHKSERRLSQDKRLHRLAGVTAAEHFLARLTMRGFDDVAVDRHFHARSSRRDHVERRMKVCFVAREAVGVGGGCRAGRDACHSESSPVRRLDPPDPYRVMSKVVGALARKR